MIIDKHLIGAHIFINSKCSEDEISFKSFESDLNLNAF